MKILMISFLTMLSTSAMATQKAIVNLVNSDNRITFEAADSTRVLYIAANPVCMEMNNSHGFPFPSAKEKSGVIEVKSTILSFDKKMRGLCNYEFVNTTVNLSLDKRVSANIRFFASSSADSEIDLLCSENGEKLECRESGQGESTSHISLYVNPSEMTKINVVFE